MTDVPEWLQMTDALSLNSDELYWRWLHLEALEALEELTEEGLASKEDLEWAARRVARHLVAALSDEWATRFEELRRFALGPGTPPAEAEIRTLLRRSLEDYLSAKLRTPGSSGAL